MSEPKHISEHMPEAIEQITKYNPFNLPDALAAIRDEYSKPSTDDERETA